MQFKAQTIVPGGRYKYGEYIAAGNVTSKVTSTIYGGNNTTTDPGNGGGTGGDTGSTGDIKWQLYLSKVSSAFDGADVALSAQSDVTSLVGLLGTQLVETYVGDITGTHTYDPNTDTYDPALPANYGITGIPATGMVVVVSNNGDTGTSLTITVDNTCTANTGTLSIPCAVSLNQMQDLQDSIIDWETAYKAGKAMPLVLEYTWSISSNNGGSTADAYRLDLTNENASINCDSNGNILPGATKPTCTAKLWYGMEAVTGVTYGFSTPSAQNVQGLSIDTSTGVLTFGSNFTFSGTPLEITVTATVNATTWRKIMTVAKAYPGANGEPATSYWLVLSHDAVKFNPNTNEAIPSAVTASAMMQVGDATPTAATGTTIYYGFDTDSPSTTYPSTGVTIDVTKKYLSFSLKKGTKIVDGIETVPIVSDGLNGTGVTPYRLDLTNENASINCDSDGNILTGAVRPTCKATLYHGTAETSASYSISGSCSYSGLSINSSTGVLTFNPGTASTPFNFNTGYTSIEITVTAKINNVTYGTAIMTVSRNIAGKNGSNGRSITGVTEYYAINNNESVAPTSWSTAMTQPTSASPYLWNYESVNYDSGSPTTTDPVIIARYTKDGKGISAITEYYQINNSTVTPPSNWSTSMVVPTNSNPYLWNYEKITYTDGSTASTSPVIIGIKGIDGRSITGVTEYYAINNDSASTPTSWSTTLQQPTSSNPYLWNYESINYSSGNPTTTDAVIIAIYTEDGKGISAITEYYQINNSTTTAPTSWSTTLVVPTDSNPYLWNYEKITYTDGSTASTTPVIIGIKGKNGDKGDDAVSYWLELSADAIVYDPNTSAVTPSSITATAWMQVGENTPTAATGTTIYYGLGNDPSRTYNGAINITKASAETYSYISFELRKGTAVVDGVETVPILKNGVNGQPGGQGRAGAAIRGPVNWYTAMEDSGRRWSNGDGPTTADTKWIDVIYKDNVYYYCNTSYTEAGQSWSAVASNWTSADTEYDFIATNLLLANGAKIKFLTNNEIYLMNSAGTEVTAGAAGGNGISFWAGSDDPGSAPFQVHYDGSIKAMSGTFAGYIQMPYHFVCNLTPDEKLSASTVGTKYLSETTWKGKLASAPADPASGWCYYNTTNSSFYYYKTGWVTMTYLGENRGYLADEHAYLISDSQTIGTDTYDPAGFVLPAPSADWNGFTYVIIVEPSLTRGSYNSMLRTIAADGSDIYCYAFAELRLSSAMTLTYGKYEITCMPKYFNYPIYDYQYVWAITTCTGGLDVEGSNRTEHMSTVLGSSYDSRLSMIYKIDTYSGTKPSETFPDNTMFVQK